MPLRGITLNVKKLHEDAVIPKYAKYGDAGMDLTATSKEVKEDGTVWYGTGLAIEIPVGYVGLLFPRSSVVKKELMLKNSVGVIDSGYRGEVKAIFSPNPNWMKERGEGNTYSKIVVANRPIIDFEVGERIAQLVIVPVPLINIEVVDELTPTDRGEGGFGSTGE